MINAKLKDYAIDFLDNFFLEEIEENGSSKNHERLVKLLFSSTDVEKTISSMNESDQKTILDLVAFEREYIHYVLPEFLQDYLEALNILEKACKASNESKQVENIQLQSEKMVNVKLELKKINNTTIEFKGNNISVIVNKNDNRVKAKLKGDHYKLVGSIEHERGVTV